jgi:hypothetical protein
MSRRNNGAEARQADDPLSVLPHLACFLPYGLAGTVKTRAGSYRTWTNRSQRATRRYRLRWRMKSTEMSRDFTPGEFEDLRTDESASRGRTPEPETKHPEPRHSPGGNPQIDRDTQTLCDARPHSARSQDSRTVFYERDRAYRLRESEVHTLSELGKFRVIATEDLATHVYQDHREEMELDIRNLAQQGLVRQGAFEGPEASRREMLTLTKEGHRLLRVNRFASDGQSSYYGFVKPKEANHDADIYRLYQKEENRILDQGGKNLRVVLDFELKKKLNRDFAT